MGVAALEHVPHQSLPPVRVEPRICPAAGAYASGVGVRNALPVSMDAPSHLCRLHFSFLGGAAHDSGPPVLCHRNDRLHLCRHLVRRARPHRVLRRPLSAVPPDRRHAVSEDPYCRVAQGDFALTRNSMIQPASSIKAVSSGGPIAIPILEPILNTPVGTPRSRT